MSGMFMPAIAPPIVACSRHSHAQASAAINAIAPPMIHRSRAATLSSAAATAVPRSNDAVRRHVHLIEMGMRLLETEPDRTRRPRLAARIFGLVVFESVRQRDARAMLGARHRIADRRGLGVDQARH